MNIVEYKTTTAKETEDVGKEVAKNLVGGEVLCLTGELGAGKTTFMRGFVNFFEPKKRVLSPTFIIMRHYQGQKNIQHIFHVDLYRLAHAEKNIQDFGFFSFIGQKDTIVAIEWSDKIVQLLPNKRIDIYFTFVNEDIRTIRITHYV